MAAQDFLNTYADGTTLGILQTVKRLIKLDSPRFGTVNINFISITWHRQQVHIYGDIMTIHDNAPVKFTIRVPILNSKDWYVTIQRDQRYLAIKNGVVDIIEQAFHDVWENGK